MDWVITAQALPLKGTHLVVSEYGGINHEVVFPTSELKVISGLLNNSNEIYDGQELGLQVTSIGESDILETSREQHFVVNGIPLYSSPPNFTRNASGVTTKVDFFQLKCRF